jgi:hypothetical protein
MLLVEVAVALAMAMAVVLAGSAADAEPQAEAKAGNNPPQTKSCGPFGSASLFDWETGCRKRCT